MRTAKLVVLVAALVLLPLVAKADSIDFHAIYPGAATWGGAAIAANSNSVSAQRIPGGGSVALNTLSFTTGGFSSSGSGVYNFASGGSISVTGGLCGGACFTGAFTSAQLLFTAGGNTATFVGNFVAGQLHSNLLAALGFPAGTPLSATGSISASFANVVWGTNSFSGDWGSGDLILTPVPEPPALVLLAFGLIGVSLLIVKKSIS